MVYTLDPPYSLKISLWLAAFVLLASPVFAQSKQVSVPDNGKFSLIRNKIEALVDTDEIPSMAVAVAKDGEVVWEEGFGWADIENRVMATPHSVYPVGSLSKSIMATGVMVLVEEGQIRLNDPINKLLGPVALQPYQGQASDVKVWHLLNMTAGIPHGWMGFSSEAKIPSDGKEKNALVNHFGKIVFEPGTFYHYSNNSIGLTEWIVEHTTGKDLDSFMDDAVFEPLGMYNSAVRVDDSIKPHLVKRYTSQLRLLDEVAYVVAPGGLGFYSSVYDLIRYGLFHLNHQLPGQKRILSKELLDEMHYFDKGPDTLFALGWFTGEQLISNGSVAGANARLTLIPSMDLAIACLTNFSSTTYIADQICNEIADIYVPDTSEKARRNRERYRQIYDRPYSPDSRLTGTWEGRVIAYDGEKPVTMTFEDDGQVYITLDNQDRARVSNTRFNAVSFFQGQFNRVLKTYESQSARETNVQIKLRLTEKGLHGYASAPFRSDLGSFSVPVYIELEQQ